MVCKLQQGVGVGLRAAWAACTQPRGSGICLRAAQGCGLVTCQQHVRLASSGRVRVCDLRAAAGCVATGRHLRPPSLSASSLSLRFASFSLSPLSSRGSHSSKDACPFRPDGCLNRGPFAVHSTAVHSTDASTAVHSTMEAWWSFRPTARACSFIVCVPVPFNPMCAPSSHPMTWPSPLRACVALTHDWRELTGNDLGERGQGRELVGRHRDDVGANVSAPVRDCNCQSRPDLIHPVHPPRPTVTEEGMQGGGQADLMHPGGQADLSA